MQPACESGQYKPVTQDEAIITSQLLKIENGINAKSVDLMMQPYAEDAYIGNFHKFIGVAAVGAPRNITKQELRGAYSQLFKGVKDLSMEITNYQLTVSGDRATAQAKVEIAYKQEAGRKEKKTADVIQNEVIWRLKRTPDGWKIQEEIFQ